MLVKQLKTNEKNKEVWFFTMLLAISGSSLLRNLLPCKRVKETRRRRGFLRAG